MVPVPKHLTACAMSCYHWLLWLPSPGREVGHLGTLEPGCILPPSLVTCKLTRNYANGLGRAFPGSYLGLDSSLTVQHFCNPCPLP